MSSVDQKRIARNTLLLYLRMAIVLVVGLYSSRIELQALGQSDYGLYGLVAKLVTAFAVLNGVMSSACNRFFSIEIGKKDYDALKKVFCLNVTVFLFLALFIIVLAETVGLWYVNFKMKYDADRASAVNIVYQLSIVAFLVSMLSTPYRAIVIAREKMSVFAYSSIVEVVLRLGAVFVLKASASDRLILYGWLMMLISVGISGFYWFYCRHFYPECRYSRYWDKQLFSEVVGFTGWSVVGNLAAVGRSVGIDALMNSFFGPLVSAARTVSYRVYSTINQFVTGYTTATIPQITKSYSAGEREDMMKLVLQSSRISFFLLFAVSLPLCIEMPPIFDVWLGKDFVPDGSVPFTRLILVNALIDAISQPFIYAVQATGRVKWYQITVGGCLLLILPVGYLMFKFGHYPAESVLVVSIVFALLALAIRIGFMKAYLDMRISEFIKDVALRIAIVTVLAPILPILACRMIGNPVWEFIAVCVLSEAAALPLILYVGMTSSERNKVYQAIGNFVKRHRK